MSFEVRPLTEDEYPLWDDFVDESPSGTVFHKSYWLEASRRRFVIYGCFRETELYAGIPITYRVEFGMKVASRTGLTPYSGIVFKEPESKYVTKLSNEKEASRQIARRLKRDFHVVRLAFSPGPVDLQPFIWEGFSSSMQYTYILQLDKSLEEILEAMDGSTRKHIRKAEKDGIAVDKSDEFDQLLKVVEKTYERQHMVMGYRYQKAATEYFKVLAQRKQCKAFLAKNGNGDYIAASYFVWDNKRAYSLHGGYNFEKSHAGAHPLAIWEAIKEAKQQLGLREYDFEGSMNPRREQFARGFGGKLVVRYHVAWARPYLKAALLIKSAILYTLLLRKDYDNAMEI